MIPVYAIFGIPGIGKTEISRILQKDNPKILHVATEEIYPKTHGYISDKGMLTDMDLIINSMALYPDPLAAETLEKYLISMMKEGAFNPLDQTILLDGYPKNLNQYDMMREKYLIQKAVYLKAPVEVCVNRIFNKRGISDINRDEHYTEILNNSLMRQEKNLDIVWSNVLLINLAEKYGATKEIDANRLSMDVYKDVYEFFKR